MRFRYHISPYISASLSVITKSLVYPPFIYILYDECSEDVTGECRFLQCIQ